VLILHLFALSTNSSMASRKVIGAKETHETNTTQNKRHHNLYRLYSSEYQQLHSNQPLCGDGKYIYTYIHIQNNVLISKIRLNEIGSITNASTSIQRTSAVETRQQKERFHLKSTYCTNLWYVAGTRLKELPKETYRMEISLNKLTVVIIIIFRLNYLYIYLLTQQSKDQLRCKHERRNKIKTSYTQAKTKQGNTCHLDISIIEISPTMKRWEEIYIYIGM
jgi:hypothetical protein